jgi:hypothetical protein
MARVTQMHLEAAVFALQAGSTVNAAEESALDLHFWTHGITAKITITARRIVVLRV